MKVPTADSAGSNDRVVHVDEVSNPDTVVLRQRCEAHCMFKVMGVLLDMLKEVVAMTRKTSTSIMPKEVSTKIHKTSKSTNMLKEV